MSINGHVGEDFALSRKDNRKNTFQFFYFALLLKRKGKSKWLKDVSTELSVCQCFIYIFIVFHGFVEVFLKTLLNSSFPCAC